MVNCDAGTNHGIVWGDTSTVSGTRVAMGVNNAVYGRIPALQNVHSGSYSDVVNVLLTF
jgi:spore coat protein U-like protein